MARHYERAPNGQFTGKGGGAAAAAAAAPAPAARTGTWTAEKERRFFHELAMVCNVSAALRAVELQSESRSVYERKRTDRSFGARWEEAIRESYSLLELEVLERSRFPGRGKPKTEVEKRLREIPSALALQLLRLHQARRAAAPAAPAGSAGGRRVSRAEGARLRKLIEAKLDALDARLREREAAK